MWMNVSRQLMRFLIVGTLTNLSLYLVYLVITWLGLDHKLAMTLVYIGGVIMSFSLNRNWTFSHNGHLTSSFLRYSLLYLFGYFLNLTGLFLLVDIAGYPHQVIQLLIAMLLAIFFFVFQRVWVFSKRSDLTI